MGSSESRERTQGDAGAAPLRRPVADLTEKDLATAGIVFQVGVAPNRIDVLTSIDGVEFEGAWQARVTRALGGLEVPVIGRDDLLRNKRATGRPKALLDAQRLEERE